MPRPKRLRKVRVNVELTPSRKVRLEELRLRTGADTMTEVVRRALDLYEVLIDSKAAGDLLFVRHKDGSESKLILAVVDET